MEVQQKQQKKKKCIRRITFKATVRKALYIFRLFEAVGVKAALYKLLNTTALQGPGQPAQFKPGILGFISASGKDEIPKAHGNMTA